MLTFLTVLAVLLVAAYAIRRGSDVRLKLLGIVSFHAQQPPPPTTPSHDPYH